MKTSRWRAVKMLVGAVPAMAAPRAFGQTAVLPPTTPPPEHIPPPVGFGVAPGPCQPMLESHSALQGSRLVPREPHWTEPVLNWFRILDREGSVNHWPGSDAGRSAKRHPSRLA